jgi:hypothetical protein
MPNSLCGSLLDNHQKATTLVAETIGQFEQEQWGKGIDFFQVPSKAAYHVVDCLGFYFREDPNVEYRWGHRFDGGWWELPAERQPTREALLAYLEDIEERVAQHLVSLNDDDLVTPYDEEKQHGETRLGHYVYALRHTVHPRGALSLLSLYYGNEEGSWA